MGELLFTCGSVNVYEQDVKSFQPDQWLTDNAISFALEYITLARESSNLNQECEILYPCFTEALKHCSDEEVPIFLQDPSHLRSKSIFAVVSDNENPNEVLGGNHWTLLVLQNDSKQFYYFDSLKRNYDEFVVKLVRRIAEHVYGSDFEWVINTVDGKQQENASDCGMHVIELCEGLMNASIEDIAKLKLDTKTLAEKRKNWIDIAKTLTNKKK